MSPKQILAQRTFERALFDARWALKNAEKDAGRAQAKVVRCREILRQRELRSCTCHPDDNPPVPCAEKYALGECRK